MSGDIFLKLDGIDGESEDHKFPKNIQVETFSWGVSNPTSMGHGTGGGVGKAQHQDVHFTKKADKSSPKLFLACSSGEHIKNGVFTFRKAGKDQQEYLKIKLSDIMVSSVSYQDHSAGGDLAHESVSISYTKIEQEYKPQKADGTLDASILAGWDVKANKKT